MSDPQILTIDELVAYSEKVVPLAHLSAELGEPRGVRIRKIASREYLALLPPLPPESVNWPTDDEQFIAAERAWLQALPVEQLEARRSALADLDLRLVALGAVDPAITVDRARRLGNDAVALAAEIKSFSGLMKQKPGAKGSSQDTAAGAAAPPPGDAG